MGAERAGGKVGIVGVGRVGQACAFALVQRGSCRELMLVDRAPERPLAVATDMRYGAPLSPPIELVAGDAGALAGADLVLITAGVNEKTGGATDRDDPRGRLRLLEPNADVYRDVVPRVIEAAPDAVLVAVTDPPDPLADLTRTLAGHDRVLSTGTVIDTLRFRTHIAGVLDVNPRSVDALVVGEHGTSQVQLWSSVSVQGTPLEQAIEGCCPDRSLAELREQVEKEVRYANITIIEGNDASQYGIGAVCARIAEAVLRDERLVMPVASYRGRHGVTIGLPSVVGREGVVAELEPAMSDDEREAFGRSVETLREAARSVGALAPPSAAAPGQARLRGKPGGP
jgi:L-lactate dehydrogenase